MPPGPSLQYNQYKFYHICHEDHDDYVPQHKYVAFLTQVFKPICRLHWSVSWLLLMSRPWSVELCNVEWAVCSSDLSMQLCLLQRLVWPHLDVCSISIQNYSLLYLLIQATWLDFHNGATCFCTVSVYSWLFPHDKKWACWFSLFMPHTLFFILWGFWNKTLSFKTW